MQRKRDGLVPIGEVFGGLDGPVKALRDASPQAWHHFRQADQVRQLVGASEEKARAGAADIPVGQNLASKEELQKAFGEVKLEIFNLRGEVRRDLAILKFAYGPIIMALLIKIAFFD